MVTACAVVGDIVDEMAPVASWTGVTSEPLQFNVGVVDHEHLVGG